MLLSSILIDSLKYSLLQDEIESMRHLVDTSNSVMSNELSVVNIVMASVAVAIAIVGICLGWYISCLGRKVESMKDLVATKSAEVELLAKTVDDTDKKIQSDITGLYAKLRKEETIALLKRLELEPLDISNLASLLLARDLGDDEYPILRSAYKKLEESGDSDITHGFVDLISKRQSYLLLFFQHYPYQSIMDEDIRQSMTPKFREVMNCAFKRDIMKSTKGVCLAISDSLADFNKEELLCSYLIALNESKYKDYSPLRSVLEENISKPGLLVDAIDACTEKGFSLQLFGVVSPTSLDS